MRKSWKIPALLCVWTCTAVTFVSTNARADTHVIKGTQDVTWESEGQSSTTNGVPLEVKVKKGDTIDIQIPAGDVPHGFVTISNRGDADPAPAPNKDLVQACGETKAKAVLRETECTATPSVFGKQFTSPPSTLKLIVQDNFQADVNFWCVVHKKRMWGTLQLKP